MKINDLFKKWANKADSALDGLANHPSKNWQKFLTWSSKKIPMDTELASEITTTVSVYATGHVAFQEPSSWPIYVSTGAVAILSGATAHLAARRKSHLRALPLDKKEEGPELI